MARPSPALGVYKLKHPLRSEPLLTVAAGAVGFQAVIEALYRNVADLDFLRGAWTPLVTAVVATLIARWQVWSKRTFGESLGEHGEETWEYDVDGDMETTEASPS